MNIAICDDEENIRIYIRKLIQKQEPFCKITEFSSGKELLEFQDETILIWKGGYKMNEVFETVAEVLEELRSEAEEREYSVHTNESENADKALEKANREYETVLAELSAEHREFFENYMDIVDQAHFQEEQRAYYQGMVDVMQQLKPLSRR